MALGALGGFGCDTLGSLIRVFSEENAEMMISKNQFRANT